MRGEISWTRMLRKNKGVICQTWEIVFYRIPNGKNKAENDCFLVIDGYASSCPKNVEIFVRGLITQRNVKSLRSIDLAHQT